MNIDQATTPPRPRHNANDRSLSNLGNTDFEAELKNNGEGSELSVFEYSQ
jgi:hypothetical protein